MKKIYYLCALAGMLLINPVFSQNLLTNGDFETGGSGVGFLTNGAGYAYLAPAAYGTTTQGKFTVATNPKLVNTSIFVSDGDHTTGSGNMLIFDGTTSANSSFWKAGSTGTGVTGLTIGTTYYFSYWIKSISTQVTTAATSANITFTSAPTGATAPVLLSGTTQAPLPALGWRQVIYSFTATASTVTLDLKNTITSTTGNDFALDDFMVTDDLTLSYNVTNAVCTVGNNGTITATAFGGTLPYVSFTLTGPGSTNVTNATGLFTNLQPGVYTLSVTDSALPTPATVTLSNVVVGPIITISTSGNNNTNLCLGSPITLSAAGSTAAYAWTASPADPTLTNPALANPIVSPVVTTTYTVTSTISLCSQISNSVVITVNPAPSITVTNPTSVCFPATVDITLPAVTSGTTGTLTYWTNATATTALATPTAITTSGTYYIKGTIGNCSQIKPVVVTVYHPVLVIHDPAAVCAPATVNLTLAAVTAGTTGGGVLSYWTDAACTIALATPTAVNASGTYYIKSTVGGCTDIQPVNVTINPQPTASISGTASVCQGQAFVITFTGTPNATVTYKVNGGPNQTIVLDATGTATLSSGVSVNTNYTLVNVISAAPASCTKAVVGTATITVTESVQVSAQSNPGLACTTGITTLTAYGTTFTHGTGAPLDPMTGATTVITNGIDDTPTAVNSIGFNFVFQGTTYTQFSVSPDGWLQLGGAASTNQPLNSITSTVNDPKLFPYWDDLATGSTGSVKVLVVGTAPNRIFIVQWNVTIPKNIAGAANSTFQMWLYETTNVIEYHYGAMGVQNSNSISGGYSINGTNFSSITFNNSTANTSVANDNNSSVPANGTLYGYAPLNTYVWSPIANLYEDAAGTIPYTGDSRAVVYAINIPTPVTYTVIGTSASGCQGFDTVTSELYAAPGPDQTICPGNVATITITGSPNTTVTIRNNDVPPITYTVNLGPTGVGIFTSPILQNTVIYEVVKVKGFTTLCESTLTNVSTTITVVPNGCATVQTVNAPDTPPLDLTLCTAGECRTLQANFSDVPSTSSYDVMSIPYCPQASFNDPSYNQVNIAIDDIWSSPITLPFNFCFFNQNYTTCQVGTNGVISFNANAFPGNCAWAYTATVPGAGFPILNAIYGVYQDLNPSILPAAPDVTSVNWKLTGTYPCRKLIVNFDSVAQFSCGLGVGLQTSQIVLYEVSNIVEVYVHRRVPCPGWNSGSGVIGIQNGAGTVGYTPPGRNTGAWSAFDEAWRFTPTGPDVPVTVAWYQGSTATGAPIGIGNTIVVCPSVTTTYTSQATYQVCGVPQTAVSSVTLNVNPDLTGSPEDITQCPHTFDLTVNDAVILGALDPTEYDITYHDNLADAENNGINPIPDPTAYIPGNTQGTYTVYASIFLNSYNCRVVKPFNLIIDCGVLPGPVPDLTVCETIYNSGVGIFNFTPQTALALGTNSPADYTISYHHTLADAIAGIAITPINPYSGTDGEVIVVKITDNLDATVFNTETFTLHVNPLPTASITGTTSICSGSTAQVCFTGTPLAVITYTINAGANQTITLDATGNACVTTPALTLGASYDLVSVTNPTTNCTQNVSGSAVITVVPLPTATISGTTAVCVNAASPLITFTGANGTAPYTFTYTDANGLQQTVSTTAASNTVTIAVSTATAGSYTYTLVSVQSTTTPVCLQNQTGSVTITVNPLPTATLSGTIAVCLNDPNPSLTFTGANGTAPYTFAYLDATNAPQTITTTSGNSATISVTSSPVGSYTYTLVSVTDSSTTACSQLQGGTATVTVNANPVISTPTPYEVCDDNNDGISCLFDLTTKDVEITAAPNVVAYYGTLTDAQTGSTSVLTSPYCSSNPWNETIYVRVYNPATPACYSVTTLQLVVNPTPQANAVITDYELCDYNNPGDLVEQFNLHTKDLEIANGQPNVTITYYPTQADAIAQNGAAALPNLYTSASQTIWLNIKDNTTGCNSVSSFNLVVNPLPAVFLPPTIIQCSNGVSTQALFDLTINHDAVTNGAGGLTVTYYTSLLNAQNANNPIATPATYLGTHNEIVYIRVEDDTTGCYSTTTQLLQVTQGPLAITPLPLHYCDPNNDGFGVFDLDSVKTQIQGGTVDPLVTIGFYETQTDAIIRANPSLTSPYNNIDPWTQTIYVSVYYTLTGCANYVQLQLIVDPTPEATTPSDFHLCDYTGAAGQEPFDLTTKIPEILGSINPVGTQVTFYTDNTAAQNGTNVGQITNVTGYLNTSTPQTIYVRVEFTATGCYDIVPLVLIVDPLPLATQPNYPQYSLCDYTGAIGHETFDLASQVSGILLGQTGMDVLFYPSLAAAQAGLVGTSINELYPSLQYVNVPAYVQTLGIRITNHITGCYSISTMDIRVNPLPSPIPPTSPYTICDNNQDGIAEFDLTTLTIDILQGANYLITYFESAIDADHNTNAIPDPTQYNNIFAFSQILYVRAEDPITHCYTVMPITIAVDPSPTAPINVPDIELCDQDSNPYNATTLINLTQNTTIVLGQQPLAASNYTVEYFTSKVLADAGTAPIIPATAYNGVDGQVIWVRVENNATGCYNLGTFTLIIHTPLLLTTPPVLNMCDDDAQPNNQHTEFDLTVRDLQINQGTGYTVTYYTNANVLITDPAHYTNSSVGPVEALHVVVTTPFGCTSSTILDIRVLPVPTPLDPSTATPELTLGVQCENATGSGVAQFDLTTNAAYIMNGDPSVTLHYFPTQADLDNNTSEILNPATAIVGDPSIAGTTVGLVQYVYIAVSSSVFSDYTGRKCYKEVKEGFVVNPLPIVAPIADYQICEQDPVTNNGIEVFDLTSQTAALLAGNATTPVSNYTIKFYEDAAATVVISNPTAYSNTSNPQPIYVVITNTTTGCKSTIGTFNIVVNPKPIIAALMPDMKECDTDGVNDGQMLFTQSGTSPLASLAGYTESVLGTTQTAPTYVIEFYDNQTSAEAGISTNALTDLENYQVHTGTYWVRVENLVTGCYQLDSFKVTIEKLARPVITSNTGSNIACVTWPTTTVVNNLILDSGITAPNYTFNWYADGQLIAGENNSTINITNVATSATHVVYTVEAVSVNPPMLGCTSVITPASTFDVIKSGQAANLSYTVTNAFAENQVITITNDGYGIYQYSMDDGPRQMSPIFENVSIGSHTIYVWDTLSPDGYSCGVQIIEDVQTIDYPHYFTPNYDGIHDSWNIHGLQNQASAKIYIFDRSGKLLKQISPTTDGWDGTYNGHLMPSDDYWFTVDYQEGVTPRQFKAHFAMKR